MTRNDIPVVAECHVSAWKAAFRGILSDALLDTLTRADFEASWLMHVAKPGRLNLIAEGNQGVIGFVALDRVPAAVGDAGEIIGIYVHPDHWRCGAGRFLLEAALSQMRSAGFSAAFLWTMKDNQRSRAFYQGCGLSLAGKTRASDRKGESFVEVKYECRLTAEA